MNENDNNICIYIYRIERGGVAGRGLRVGRGGGGGVNRGFSLVVYYATLIVLRERLEGMSLGPDQCAGAWQSYLEQLYANDGEHELQEAGDEDYVSDSLYRYDDALYYVLGSTLIIIQIRSFTEIRLRVPINFFFIIIIIVGHHSSFFSYFTFFFYFLRLVSVFSFFLLFSFFSTLFFESQRKLINKKREKKKGIIRQIRFFKFHFIPVSSATRKLKCTSKKISQARTRYCNASIVRGNSRANFKNRGSVRRNRN